MGRKKKQPVLGTDLRGGLVTPGSKMKNPGRKSERMQTIRSQKKAGEHLRLDKLYIKAQVGEESIKKGALRVMKNVR